MRAIQIDWHDGLPKMRKGQRPSPKEGILTRLSRSSEWRGDCRVWLRTTTNGYGFLGVGDKNKSAHRAAYEVFVGPIAEGLQIDHLCRNRDCINPAHLEPVTQRENILRGDAPPARAARKTHCPKGHEYAGYNLCVDPKRGDRQCRTCRNEKQRGRVRSRKSQSADRREPSHAV